MLNEIEKWCAQGIYALDEVLKTVLDISMYESRRSFWTEYKLKNLESYHNKLKNMTSYLDSHENHTGELEQVLEKHTIEKISKMETEHIKKCICEYMMLSHYYKAEAEKISNILKDIIDEYAL